MTIYVNKRAFRPVGDVQHLLSIFLRSEIDFLVAKTVSEFATKFHPSMWCYMDPEHASRPGSEGCRQVTAYGQLLYDDFDPVSFFQGTKTDSRQNYIIIGGSTYASSLHNNDEIDIIHFAGIWYYPITPRESSLKITKCHVIESDHVSPFKKEPALCLRQIKRARKWQPRVREKLERGRCGFELSVTVLMKSFVAVQEIDV